MQNEGKKEEKTYLVMMAGDDENKPPIEPKRVGFHPKLKGKQ